MVTIALILVLASSISNVDASPSHSFLRGARKEPLDDFDGENSDDIDFQSSFKDFPHLTDSIDFESHEPSLESSLFEDLSQPSIPQFRASSLFNDGSDVDTGFRLSGPRYLVRQQKTGVSFQTSSSSSSSFSTGLDGRIHEQVVQQKSQRGGNGQASKSISASRICVDGNCNMKTVESTAPHPGVEFVEGVTMTGPQGGLLDKHMSLMLGMNDHRLDQLGKKSSMEESDATGERSSSDKLVHSKKKDAWHASHMGSTSDVSQGGRNSSSASHVDRAYKGARPEMDDAPVGNEIIMLMPSDDDVNTSTEEGHSEPEDEV